MPTDFEDLRHLGDELEPALRESFLRMVGAAERYADGISGAPDILEMIASGNTGALRLYAERLLSQGLIPNSLDFMNIMVTIMLRAGEATIATTALDLPLRDSILDIVRDFSMQRGRRKGGQWVTGISNDTAGGMRSIMADALKRGVGAEQLGRELRGSVGLLPSHQIAALNYEELLRENQVSEQTYTRLSRMYRRRLLAYRAEMISRTETMFAVHAGQMMGWQAQILSGLIQPQRTWIEWITTEDDRLCDRCAPMDGKRVRLPEQDSTGEWIPDQFVADERGFPDGKPAFVDSPYDRRKARVPGETGDRSLKPRIPVKKASDKLVDLDPPIKVDHPPLHPNCRCTLRLRFE